MLMLELQGRRSSGGELREDEAGQRSSGGELREGTENEGDDNTFTRESREIAGERGGGTPRVELVFGSGRLSGLYS
jgi:hypothetical protein